MLLMMKREQDHLLEHGNRVFIYTQIVHCPSFTPATVHEATDQVSWYVQQVSYYVVVVVHGYNQPSSPHKPDTHVMDCDEHWDTSKNDVVFNQTRPGTGLGGRQVAKLPTLGKMT